MIITLDGNIPSKWAHSVNVMKMAQGFHQNGEDVTVVSFLSLQNILEVLKTGNIHKYYCVTDKIKIKLLPAITDRFFNSTIGNKPYYKEVARYARKRKANFIYSRSVFIPEFCIKNNIPTIIESHNTSILTDDFASKIYEHANNECFLGFVTIHEYMKQELIKRGIPEEKILVLEDSVDINRFDIEDDKYYWRKELNLPVDKNIMMYSGSLFEEKGIDHILLTAKKLENDNTLCVLVGGRKENITHWKQYCIKNNIKNILFIGHVSNGKIPSYLKAANVLIMPYNTNIKCTHMAMEITSPLKLFEYMAAKRPIISTNLETIAKIVPHEKMALLAEPNNIDMLACFVKELFNNPEKAKYLANNAYEKVKNYTWENRCKLILEKFVKGNKLCG